MTFLQMRFKPRLFFVGGRLRSSCSRSWKVDDLISVSRGSFAVFAAYLRFSAGCRTAENRSLNRTNDITIYAYLGLSAFAGGALGTVYRQPSAKHPNRSPPSRKHKSFFEFHFVRDNVYIDCV